MRNSPTPTTAMPPTRPDVLDVRLTAHAAQHDRCDTYTSTDGYDQPIRLCAVTSMHVGRDGRCLIVGTHQVMGPMMADDLDDLDDLDEYEFGLDALVTALGRYELPAYVEMTGGGCATLYIGRDHIDENGDRRWDMSAGPGDYASRTGHIDEFYWSADIDDPDDFGRAGHTDTADSIAGHIARFMLTIVARRGA